MAENLLPSIKYLSKVLAVCQGFSRVGSGNTQNLADRVGSGLEIFKISRDGSGRVGSEGFTSHGTERIGSPLSDPTREKRPDS